MLQYYYVPPGPGEDPRKETAGEKVRIIRVTRRGRMRPRKVISPESDSGSSLAEKDIERIRRITPDEGGDKIRKDTTTDNTEQITVDVRVSRIAQTGIPCSTVCYPVGNRHLANRGSQGIGLSKSRNDPACVDREM